MMIIYRVLPVCNNWSQSRTGCVRSRNKATENVSFVWDADYYVNSCVWTRGSSLSFWLWACGVQQYCNTSKQGLDIARDRDSRNCEWFKQRTRTRACSECELWCQCAKTHPQLLAKRYHTTLKPLILPGGSGEEGLPSGMESTRDCPACTT